MCVVRKKKLCKKRVFVNLLLFDLDFCLLLQGLYNFQTGSTINLRFSVGRDCESAERGRACSHLSIVIIFIVTEKK